MRLATPGTSTSRTAVSSRDSRAASSVTTTAAIATGTLRKKIDCQLTSCTSRPPSTGPIASAIADTPAQVPIARPRSWGSKVLVMIERVAGIMKPAPTPWTARNAISQVSLWESPIRKLAVPNTITPKRNIRRRPKMSPSRPPVTSVTAKVSV